MGTCDGIAGKLTRTEIQESLTTVGEYMNGSEIITPLKNVSNLLDRDPPLMADAVVSNNTDTRLYDIFGRSYSFTMTYQF